MKILAFAFDYRPRLGGVATCSYELLRALSRIPGVQIRLIARSMPGDADFDGHGFFETRRIPLPQESYLAVSGISLEMARQIPSWKPDVILDLLWLPSGVASLLNYPLRKIYKVPYFVFAHAVEVIESTRTRKKRLRSWFSPAKCAVLRNAAKVLAVSRFTRDLVTSGCGLDESKIALVYNGVDPDDFHPAPKPADLVKKYGLEGKFVFLTVARLDDYKGMDRAISALRQVVTAHPETVYLICGEGNDRGRLESIARHYRVDQNVIFAGAIPFDRLRDYFNVSDCFVLLSREDREAPNVEGFGIVFLEAAACEKPSIGGRSGGIPDAVEDGVTGWLVDPQDDAAIAATFMECLSSPSRTQARGRAARKRVVESMTWDHMAARVIRELRDHVRN